MRESVLIMLLVALMAEWCQAQKIPLELQQIVNNYAKDSTVDYGFNFAKKWLHLDSSLKSTDIEVGIPIEEYTLRYDVLDTCRDDIPVKFLIQPSNYWILPIRAHGQYIYEITISKSSGTWQMVGAGELGPVNLWQKLRKSYPESSGIIPIKINDGRWWFYHFPQLGLYNLTPVRPDDDSISIISSKSFDKLDDSRKIIKYRKKEWKNQKKLLEEENKKAPIPILPKGLLGGDK